MRNSNTLSTITIAWQAGLRREFPQNKRWRNWISPGRCNLWKDTGDQVEYKLLIDGRWVGDGPALEVKNKYSGETVGVVATARREDLDAAIDAAERAEAVMAEMPTHKRAEILLKAAALIRDRA